VQTTVAALPIRYSKVAEPLPALPWTTWKA
jgi:hypothetical protein